MARVPNPVTIYHPELETTAEVDASTVEIWTKAGWVLNGVDQVTVPRPSGNAAREDWVRYAEQIGIPVDEHQGRNEIRKAVDDFERAADTSPADTADDNPVPQGDDS